MNNSTEILNYWQNIKNNSKSINKFMEDNNSPVKTIFEFLPQNIIIFG